MHVPWANLGRGRYLAYYIASVFRRPFIALTFVDENRDRERVKMKNAWDLYILFSLGKSYRSLVFTRVYSYAP